MLIEALLTLLILSIFTVEAILVHRRVNSIPVRIHVGGTRGKSSVTRYVTAALRRTGHRVLGKVTGVHPTILLPDGTQRRIRRRGPARVQEQVRMVSLAHRLGCDAIVLECMSVAPPLQEFETRLLRPTLSILTNILDDHREEFGATQETRLEGYSAFFPTGSTLVSGERTLAGAIDIRARQRRTRVATPSAEDGAAAALLPIESHRTNVALALAACRELGIPEAEGRAAIEECLQDDGTALITRQTASGEIRFLNGFAVNDVPSAEAFLAEWHERMGGWSSIIVLLNTRTDRPYRSLQFARWCATLHGLETVALLGRHAPRARRELLRLGFPGSRIRIWGKHELRDPLRALSAVVAAKGAIVVGLGNIAGDGFTILERLQA